MLISMKEIILKILSKAKSWSDIYNDLAKLNSENPKLAGTLFEHFCKYYYLTELTVASDYKNVWLYEEAPQEVKERLNIAKQDHGIDLILIDHEDAYTVVQCKFRNDQSSRLSWTKDKIANLFAEADRADFIIVFSNASDLDEYSKNKQAKKFHLVTLGELLNIQPKTIQQMAKSIEHKPIQTKLVRTPREHQMTAIKKVLAGFQIHDRGQLILPCGAGKTLTALWIKEQLNPNHTLVLVPSLALLRQIKNEWHSTQTKWLPYLCVCSERDIDSNIDTPVVHTYEIGGRVTTEVQEIRDFLAKHRGTIIYSTYQSLDVISKAISLLNFQFDLAICDEAHKTAGSKISSFGLIHNDIKVPVRKRLYMTATPRIVSEQAKNKLGEDHIKYLADMADPKVFGPEFYRMSFAEAINKNILVDYQIIAIGVSDSVLQKQVSERQFAGDEATTIEDIANNYALEKVMMRHGATHAITFHSSIKRAEQFKERHQKYYPSIFTDHVSGLQTTNNRNITMNRFKNSPKAVITNARCLTEGVDVPTIDVVYFCDPKNSKIDIVQASGRALRQAVHKSKKFGYIVVPIFHQEQKDVEKTIGSSAFKNLITIVRALCDQDERLVEEINKIKIGKGIRKPTSQSAHIKIEDELPLIVLENFEEKLKSAIFDQIIEKAGDNWIVMYELLKEFRVKNPSRWPNFTSKLEKERILARWCSHRRSEYKDCILEKERIEALNKIGFPWNLFEQAWDENFNKLMRFRKNHPNRWPTHGVGAQNLDERQLGAWCAVQRKDKDAGKLPEEKINRLEGVKFPWEPLLDKWNFMFSRLEKFRKNNPTRWPSSMSTIKEEKELGRWCNRLRKAYNAKQLTQDRIRQLNLLNFPWNLEEERWNTMITLLKAFRLKNPTRWPSYLSKDSSEKKLSIFLRDCRTNRKRLDNIQKAELNQLCFLLDISHLKEDEWQENYKKLISFRGKCPDRWPSHGSKDLAERQLGQWSQNQRRKFHKNELTSRQSFLLKKIDFPWDALKQRYDIMLKKLKEFRRKSPDRWPNRKSKDRNERKLEKWCSLRKIDKKNGKIDKDLMMELNKMEFPWKQKPGPKRKFI